MFSRIVVRVQRTAFADIQKRFKYTLPDVPYATTGISNFLSQNSVSEHLKLHKLDVERANNLIQRTPWENTTINQAIVQSSTSREDAPFFEAASSHFNHSFFWRSITDVKQTPSVYMKKAVEIDFGSFKDFQIKFSQNASALNVPGFTWLVFHDKALKIVNTFGNGSPLELRNCHPILCLDLFEHSYISDYQSNKNKYIANFWNCINWEFVESKFLNALIADKEYKLRVESLVEEEIAQQYEKDKVNQALIENRLEEDDYEYEDEEGEDKEDGEQDEQEEAEYEVEEVEVQKKN